MGIGREKRRKDGRKAMSYKRRYGIDVEREREIRRAEGREKLKWFRCRKINWETRKNGK